MIDPRARELRLEYEAAGLDERTMAPEPFSQFEEWFEGVNSTGIEEPNAFVLATVGASGRPAARAVLMKDFSSAGLVFYTNLDSRKSRELKANPQAAATFVWVVLHRQVRFEGVVEPVEENVADAYFATRPRGAQLAAHASQQSRPVHTREDLDRRFREFDQRYPDAIPRPVTWGGWRLRPDMVEFWQGQPNRFHDRVRYVLDDSGWRTERLSP